MPRPPFPLPASLGPVFSAAEARRVGVSARRLRQPDVVRLGPGLYRRHPENPPSTYGTHPDRAWRDLQIAQARALASSLAHGQFYAGFTAAALWELPVPRPTRRAETRAGTGHDPGRGSRDPWQPDDRITIGCCTPRRISRRHGQRALTLSPHLATVVEHNGLPVTDPATTWAVVAPLLRRDDAVALGDAIIRDHRIAGTTRFRRPQLATAEDLAAASALRYRRHSSLLGELLPLLSTHSASPPESHLRLRIREWELPEPELDYDVRAANGVLLGCSEFAWPRYRLAAEYEGDHHRKDGPQWNRDIEKYHYYERHGWEAVRATSSLLYRQQPELRRRLAEALRDRGWDGR
ncbi:hypothetical protein [Leucobacter triazinivorans]|uniref:DUF559 domain-containing protein n=1 Tax=Leucobacter triazinivorans TaxID=1784719 RepID=A0A4P6KH69_9MICO|nr:hypothetical protein [Leucobacter triazinivorans]QBE49887.1 hypothetical protein EVS81_14485 [Leucobacter triazinivorans]